MAAADGSSNSEWYFNEDGSLSVNDSCQAVYHHPNLNIILVVTKEPAVKVIDVNSGSLLQKSNLSADYGSQLHAAYIPKYDRLLFSDGRAIGLRKDHSGMLLLDSILQVPVNKADEIVKIEISFAEALKLLKCLVSFHFHLPGMEATEDFIKELDKQVFACQASTKKNHKLAKWCTVCLELPLGVIKSVCSNLVYQLKRVNKLVPALAIASAINERLGSLLSCNHSEKDIASKSAGVNVDRTLMYSEAARKETFVKWPHMTYKWALPDQMAQAGFYHQPNSTGDDRALCFTCNVCLVCWEPTDEPWSEHERHSPSCPFVKGEYTQNVPLSVSYATSPAQRAGMEPIHCLSTSSCNDLMATSTRSGQIMVWNVSKQLKKELQFCIDPSDSILLSKRLDHMRYDDSQLKPTKEAWSEGISQLKLGNTAVVNSTNVKSQDSSTNDPCREDVSTDELIQSLRPSKDVLINKLCILGYSDICESNAQPRPALVVGMLARKCDFGLPSAIFSKNGTTNMVQAMNDVNQSSSQEGPLDIMKLDDLPIYSNLKKQNFLPYILVYDIHPEQALQSKSSSSDVPAKVQQPSTSGSIKEKTSIEHQPEFTDSFYDMCVKPSIDEITDFVAEMQQSLQNDDAKLDDSSSNSPYHVSINTSNGSQAPKWVESSSDPQNAVNDPPILNANKLNPSEQPSEGLLKQCIELPGSLNNENFCFSEIVPSNDGEHLIVSVGSCVSEMLAECNTDNCSSNQSSNDSITGALLVFKVNSDSEVISINEVPAVIRHFTSDQDNVTSVLVLPIYVTDFQVDSSANSIEEVGPLGFILVTTIQGKLVVYRLNDLNRIAEFSPKNDERFISATYLNSIDRICACTEEGTMYFLQLSASGLVKDEKDSSETQSDVAKNGFKHFSASERIRESSEFNKEESFEYPVKTESFLINKPFTSENLNMLYDLTQFENLTPKFSVTMPPCWTEIQQEQKQRRHPQHLQQHGEAMQHTRSWRLQSDFVTWDEHLFELSLSHSCCIGHIDFKFNLHPSFTSLPPKIQITLLKQVSGGMSRQMNYSKTSSSCEAVDSAINFNIKSEVDGCEAEEEDSKHSTTNPVLSDDYLSDHNAEIICGPVDLSSCIDMSGQSGVVTLTSPSLFKTKSRTFLLHIKALNVDKEPVIKSEISSVKSAYPKLAQKKIRVKSKLNGNVPSLQAMLDQYITPGSTVDRLAVNAANKKLELKGCDWFHEVSITIRRTKKVDIPQERFQRCAILETPSFHQRLIMAVCGHGFDVEKGANYDEIRHSALDILIWVASIQINAPVKVSKEDIMFLVQANLSDLINTNIIHGDRTIARKCCKLIVICMEYSKQMEDSDSSAVFSYSLLQALVECLPLVLRCESCGALKWFFLLLNRVKYLDVTKVGEKALHLLLSVSKEIRRKTNLYHMLLNSRFGLYGNPFDPNIFDIDPPAPQKPTSTVLTYASVVTANNNGSNGNGINSQSGSYSASGNSDNVDFRDLLNLLKDKNSSHRLTWLPQNQNLFGLLEVEPLHFVCHAASDGTKMEKMESGSSNVSGASSLLPISSNTWYDHNNASQSSVTEMNNHPKAFNQSFKIGYDSPAAFNSLVSTFQQKQDMLAKLKKAKQKMDQKLTDDVNSSSMPVMASSPSTSSSALGYQPTPTPKTTPLFMTPPLTPPNDHNFVGSAENDSVGPPVVKLVKPSSTVKETKVNDITINSSPWQHLLQPPNQQMLVIERMHSGARRFVVLDFGHPILLTDLMIPSCPELISLSIDVWVQSEEYDGQRLIVSTDIGIRSLIISDLQPPAYCQYLKITIIGRYGMSTTRCRIPIGYFFGHTFMLPWEKKKYALKEACDDNNPSGSKLDPSKVVPQLQAQLMMLEAFQEDIHCRYNLACSKLQTLLQPYIYQESANASHTHYHLQSIKAKDHIMSDEDQKVMSLYNECIQLQQQLNLVCQAILRLKHGNMPRKRGVTTSVNQDESLNNLSYDKLRVIADSLLDVLIGLTCPSALIPQLPKVLSNSFDNKVCSIIFNNLCINTSYPTQLNATTLLVRMCAVQPWWGSFLASTYQSLFSSVNSHVFPQDRIFILMTYLGQKSLLAPKSSSVLESFLNLLSFSLESIYNSVQSNCLRGMLDLSLVGWILLFLSSCLDSCELNPAAKNGDENEDSDNKGRNNRWTFIQGEMTSNKNIHSVNKNSSSKSYRRKLQKRLMHHKQQIDDLEFVKKALLASTKAMSPVHGNIGGSIEAAVKQQEEAFAKTLKQHQSKHFIDIIQIKRSESGLAKALKSKNEPGPSTSSSTQEVDEKERLVLNYDVCINTARRLIALLLHMDFTSSVDLLLLICKITARVVTLAKPKISLGNLMTENQLHQLLRIVVKNNSNNSISHQWVTHAISCLLLDIIDGEQLENPLSSQANSTEESDASNKIDDIIKNAFNNEESAGPSGWKSNLTADPGYMKELPMFMDTDDSSDEYVVDYSNSNDVTNAMQEKSFNPSSFASSSMHKKSAGWSGLYNAFKQCNSRATKDLKSSDLFSGGSTSHQMVSAAMDCRLEFGVEMTAELRLRIMSSMEQDTLYTAIHSTLPNSSDDSSEAAADDHVDPTEAFQLGEKSSSEMLSSCFNAMFMQLHTGNVDLEAILTLWLSLNCDTSDNYVPISSPSMSALLMVMAWSNTISIRVWCLFFKCVINSCGTKSQLGVTKFDVANFLNDTNLFGVLMKFLSGSSFEKGTKSMISRVGPTVQRTFQDMVSRLFMCCNIVIDGATLGDQFRELIFKLIQALVSPSGPISCGQGPLDVQGDVIRMVLYKYVDVNVGLNIVESVTSLIHNYIVNKENVNCSSHIESSVNASACFGGIFAGVLKNNQIMNQDSSQDNTGNGENRDSLLCSALEVACQIVKFPLVKPTEAKSTPSMNLIVDEAASVSSDESQTDEHKTACGSNANCSHRFAPGESKVPCIADKVLSNQTIIDHLLTALSKCTGSNMAILLGTGPGSSTCNISADVDKFIFGEPVSVGDGIFHLLCSLNNKASNIELVLRPVYHWLSSTLSMPGPVTSPLVLSEPLIWFLLRMLDCSESLNKFQELGGIQLIAKHLVRCHSSIMNSNPSLVSMIMQHLSQRSTPPPSNPLSSSSRKYTEIDSWTEGLNNFAPLGTITSSNPTTQPAESLIHSVPPHPRARTPAWSYHFYPEENWIDLMITLPCAILLHEIQVQPHLTSLSTCPSAISVDISRSGLVSELIPLCHHKPTSGLTFIRLTLSKPEIVTAVSLRLHKPRDSNNMGLSQILLFGSTTFSNPLHKHSMKYLPCEEIVARSSLGWLRLLHHCFTSQPQNDSFITSAASVSGLLESCCSLLQTPGLWIYLSHIEKVLLAIGLHNDTWGLSIINILLDHCSWTLQFHYGPSSNSTNSIPATDAIMDIMYTLCSKKKETIPLRVRALLEWLHRIIPERTSLNFGTDENVMLNENHNLLSPSYIHCIAAILWQCHDQNSCESLFDLITPSLLCSLCDWTLSTKNINLKQALDSVLCSICYIKPDYFQLLLNRLGFMNSSAGSLTDNQKNLEASQFSVDTDDFKQAHHFSLQDFQCQQLLPEKLSSLALICQSPPIVKQLLDCGFMTMLAQVILDFCAKEIVNQTSAESKTHRSMTDFDKQSSVSQLENDELNFELIISILKFFTKVANDGIMRDWLGGSDGSSWWLPLLSVLCNSYPSTSHPSVLSIIFGEESSNHQSTQKITELENTTIDFLSTCCWCHPLNQRLIAEVLCSVVCKERLNRSDNTILGISGFTRRLILQLLLENERILVYIKSSVSVPLHKPPPAMLGDGGLGFLHPKFSCGHNVRTIYINTQMTMSEIITSLSDLSSMPIAPSKSSKKADKAEEKISDNKNKISELGVEFANHISLAAGALAKDKRQKDNLNAQKTSLRPPTRRGKGSLDSAAMTTSLHSLSMSKSMSLFHDLLPNQPLPEKLTVAQLMVLLEERGHSLSFPYLTLKLKSNKNSENAPRSSPESEDKIPEEILLSCVNLPSTLQIFASMGGLSLLAQHLPLLYPEISRQIFPKSSSEKSNSNIGKSASGLEPDWVKVDNHDEMFDDYPEVIPHTSSSLSNSSNAMPPPSIPPYSLAAFGLFLRLPGYAEVLLKERQKAQCLLRLALGVTDDADGSDIFNSNIDPSLPTLPFLVLQQLFNCTPLTTDDGLLLRKMALDVGAIHLLLACLSVLSHQNSEITLPGFQHEAILVSNKAIPKSKGPGTTKNDDKSHLYWAKGTGFGTGSTAQSWDVEQHILRQKCEEEHVTCLLLVLASYINPEGHMDSGDVTIIESQLNDFATNKQIPAVFVDLLTQSCLLPAMSSYLRNDSVLDMARHVPLYQSLLKLLRSLASSKQLVSLLLPQKIQAENSGAVMSICSLLSKMKTCVDTYTHRLKSNKMRLSGSKGKGKRSSSDKEETDEETEGLALLIPDIQETARLVATATQPYLIDAADKDLETPECAASLIRQMNKSVEERYMEVLKALQFDTHEMITEDDDGIRFTISHHFESNMRAGGDNGHPSRARRLAQETVTLSTSLPLSYNSTVFVRCDQDRLDLMKVLITGPTDTPYANGCFEFDVYFPPDYPNSPMLINLETTGHHTVRFNPNLYNDGKVCLSILNTWHGRPEEKWNSNTSSFLQVLVSIQSLILVADPYFNEPGYERSRGTVTGNQSSKEYDANIRQATIKWAILEQLRNPCLCFKTIIHKHLWMKRGEILKQCEAWIADMESINSDRRSGKTISLNTQALKRHMAQLQEEFAKMKPPEGLEDWTEEMTSSKVETPQVLEEKQSVSKLDTSMCMNGDLSPKEEANVKLLTASKTHSTDLCDLMFKTIDENINEYEGIDGSHPTTSSSLNETDNQYMALPQQLAESSIAEPDAAEDKESIC